MSYFKAATIRMLCSTDGSDLFDLIHTGSFFGIIILLLASVWFISSGSDHFYPKIAKRRLRCGFVYLIAAIVLIILRNRISC